MNRRANGSGTVENDGGIDALGNRRLQKWQFAADIIVGLDDIRAWLAEDEHHDPGYTVQKPAGAQVRYTIDYLCYIREVDNCPVVAADDDWFVVGRGRDLVIGDNIGGYQTIGNLSFGQVGILRAQHGLNVGQG